MDNNDFATDIITLVDDEGNENEYEVADAMDVGDDRYMALIPVLPPEEALDDAGDLLVLKVAEEDGEEYLVSIEDEEEFSRIADEFMKRLEEIYEFTDEDAN